MLLETNSLKGAVAIAALVLAGVASAQTAAPQKEVKEVTADDIVLPSHIPLGGLSGVDPAKLKEAKEAGISMVRDILNAYETQRTPEMEEFASETKRKVDSIADAAMAEDRAKVLEFLGIDPEGETGLYYFVSWSMPLEMLRSYAVEAMWSGGTLVFKGVPPGRPLGEFLTKDLRQLVYGKGAAASISIDPRLFDAYAVKTVPTIAFTTVKADMQCRGILEVPVKVGDVEASYDQCPPLDESKYWKISGSVTSNYALNAFIEDGAHQAKPHAAALARGWAGQSAPGKEQKAFSAKWDDALSPSQIQAAQEAAKAVLTPAAGSSQK